MSESTNEVPPTPEGVCDQCWAWAEVWLERLAEGKYTNRPLHCDKKGCSAKAAAHILRAITDADAANARIAQLTKERDSSQAREAKYTSLWTDAESRVVGLTAINKRLNQDVQDVVDAKDKEVAALKAELAGFKIAYKAANEVLDDTVTDRYSLKAASERDAIEIQRLNDVIASGPKSSGPAPPWPDDLWDLTNDLFFLVSAHLAHQEWQSGLVSASDFESRMEALGVPTSEPNVAATLYSLGRSLLKRVEAMQ